MKPKILIVEDNLVIAELLDAVCDFAPRVIAYNGQQAKSILPWADCVCTDGDFPANHEFYDALIKSNKPFVIYSGNVKYKGQGEIAFVLKPDIMQLRQALSLLLDETKNRLPFELKINYTLLNETAERIRAIKQAITVAQASATEAAELIRQSVEYIESIEARLSNIVEHRNGVDKEAAHDFK